MYVSSHDQSLLKKRAYTTRSRPKDKRKTMHIFTEIEHSNKNQKKRQKKRTTKRRDQQKFAIQFLLLPFVEYVESFICIPSFLLLLLHRSRTLATLIPPPPSRPSRARGQLQVSRVGTPAFSSTCHSRKPRSSWCSSGPPGTPS